jgi:hypothetical protein
MGLAARRSLSRRQVSYREVQGELSETPLLNPSEV